MKVKSVNQVLVSLLCIFIVLFGVTYGKCLDLEKENSRLMELYCEVQSRYYKEMEKNTKLLEKNSPLKDYSQEDIYLLAQCVEAEAGYYEGHETSQQYVAQVILNRVHSDVFPDTVEEVIYQEVCGVPQFSVAYNGMMYREVKAETLANVYYVLYYGTDLPEYVYYFYSDKVTNNWVNTLNIYTSTQGTVFAYSDFDKEVCS